MAAVLTILLVAGLVIAVMCQAFIWRTTYENHAWWRMTHRLSGEHRWVRKPHTGYSPIPWLDGETVGNPPEGGSVVSRPARPTQ